MLAMVSYVANDERVSGILWYCIFTQANDPSLLNFFSLFLRVLQRTFNFFRLRSILLRFCPFFFLVVVVVDTLPVDLDDDWFFPFEILCLDDDFRPDRVVYLRNNEAFRKANCLNFS
jgi:hypothetical protein